MNAFQTVPMVHGTCVVWAAKMAHSFLGAKRGTTVVSCLEPDDDGIAETVIVLNRRGIVLCSVRIRGDEVIASDTCTKNVLPGIP